MASFDGKFESARQDWETPLDLFNPINDEFHFTLDAAASSTNTKVAGSFLDEESDGLVQSWGTHTVWLNPPYGNGKKPISAWVKKAYEESLTGATTVMLIPARTNTNWFHDYCLAKGEVRFVRGRPKFGGAAHGLPQPLCLVIFRPEVPLPGSAPSDRQGDTERDSDTLGTCDRRPGPGGGVIHPMSPAPHPKMKDCTGWTPAQPSPRPPHPYY